MLKGSCLCKGFQFEVHGEFGKMMTCHCSICRKSHGSDYATWVTCKSSDYQLISGEALVSSYQSSEKGHRRFCKQCGASLPVSMGEQMGIPASLLDGDPGVRVSAHMFAGSKAAWVTIESDAPQFDTYPNS